MRDGETLAPFVYAPTEIKVDIKGVKTVVTEETSYPFENVVKFKINPESNVKFSLLLRRPAWATAVKIALNGNEYKAKFKNNVCKIEREFAAGDEIVISFEDKIEYIENARGVSVKKGPLLYALPIKEKVVIEGLRNLGNKLLPHYSVYGESKWNFGLCLKDSYAEYVKVCENGAQPWRQEQNGSRIRVAVAEIKNWKLINVKKFKARYASRGPLTEVIADAQFTPVVGKVNEEYVGEREVLELVPYCSTRLRIAIFPKVFK